MDSQKTATALFGVGFMQHHAADGMTANAVHPGAILTTMWGLSQEGFVEAGLIDADGRPHPEFRSHEQGAATTVWAAVAPELEGIGGRYLENCAIAGEMPDASPLRWPPGYKPHALDPEDANRLWSLSQKLTIEG
jgi:NAD(P)-dependent dehydrogenase (short-subunit alcohol dehydrogenase family)